VSKQSRLKGGGRALVKDAPTKEESSMIAWKRGKVDRKKVWGIRGKKSLLPRQVVSLSGERAAHCKGERTYIPFPLVTGAPRM